MYTLFNFIDQSNKYLLIISEKPINKTKFQLKDGTEHFGSFGGLLARIFQHEMDHMEGDLYIDMVSDFRRLFIILNGISTARIRYVKKCWRL